MKKIIEVQNERKELKIAKSKTKNKAEIKAFDAKLKETVERWNALKKEYDTAIDDEPKTYGKPQ